MPRTQHGQLEPTRHSPPALDVMRIGNAAKVFLPRLRRDAMLRKARLIETASHINDWAASRGLRAPR